MRVGMWSVTRFSLGTATVLLTILAARAQDMPRLETFPAPLPANSPVMPAERQAAIDRDLMEVTIPQLQNLYQTLWDIPL